MTKPEWGTKRTCGVCAVPFYDMGRAPPVCPKCETVWEAPKSPRAKRGGADAKPPRPVKEAVLDEAKKKAVPSDDDEEEDFAIEGDDDFAIEDDDEDEDLIEDTSDLEDDNIVDVRGRLEEE